MNSMRLALGLYNDNLGVLVLNYVAARNESDRRHNTIADEALHETADEIITRFLGGEGKLVEYDATALPFKIGELNPRDVAAIENQGDCP